MYCTNCGHRVGDDHNFCTNCGARVARIQPSIVKSGGSPANLTASEKALLAQIAKINKQDKEMPAELYQKMRDFEVAWLERNYDFTSIAGINAIPVTPPPINAPSGNVTGQVEYYLLKKAGQFEKDNNADMAIACYRKANQLMQHCSTAYSKDYFMRLPNYLRKLRRFDDARSEEAKIDSLFPNDSNILNEQKMRIERNQQIAAVCRDGSDLVEVSSHSACCEVCGRYRGRIFSLFGKDKRFPAFPNDFCTKCGLTYYQFWEEASTPTYSKARGRALVREMNRPFVDSRTKEEIAMFEEKTAEALRKKQNRVEYNWLWEHHPEICPKSLSGYSRMKSSNSVAFQKICMIVAQDGFEIVRD